MATSSPSQPARKTRPTYNSVKAALERVRSLEAVCRVLDSYENIQVQPHLEAIVKRLLEDGWLTWRWLILYLDEASETDAADYIRGFAEPLADPTLTVNNVTTVLNEAEDWRSVAMYLVPRARQAVIDQQHSTLVERQSAAIEYYVGARVGTSWETLACALYRCGEGRALNAIKMYLPNEKDPSLTTDNVMEEIGEVEGKWRDLGNELSIPTSKCNDISATHNSDCDRLRALVHHWIHNHPCPSWRRLIWALQDMRMPPALTQHIIVMYGGGSELAHYRVAMENGIIRTTNHNIVFMGITGGGKTHTMCLLLEKDPPKERTSTPCAERPIQTTHAKQGEGRWVQVSPVAKLRMIAKAAKALPGPTKQTFSQKSGPTPQDSSSQPHPSPPPSPLQSPRKGVMSRIDHFQKYVLFAMEGLSTTEAAEEVHFINLVDSGGQQQFHELLPDFLPNTTALVFVHNASQPLQHYPLVEMFEKDKLIGSCHSPFNNLQIIQRCLQIVQSELVRGQCPVIVFIGTHGDLEHEWTESRAEKNAKLRELLTPEMVQRVIFFGESLDEPLCVINAKTPGPLDKKLARDLRNAIEKCSLAKSHPIPLQWHGLDGALQDRASRLMRGVLSKEECLEVAQTLHFTPESLEKALLYLSQLKQLCYYSFLPNIVFANSQVLLDKISELVRFHYRLREAPSSDILAGGRLNKFRDQGLVSLDLLKEECFSAHYVSELFGPEQLLLVLEKLLIVAKVSDEDYLMPCLLPHVEGERIDQCPSTSVSPLLVHFTGGPRLGVFCHLLAYLLKEAKWELVYKDHKPLLVNRNSVAFTHPDLPCQVTLSDPFLSHFHVSVRSQFPEELPFACRQIRATILTGIDHVCANLGYSDCVPVDAFLCSAEDCCHSSPHPATVMHGCKYLSCTVNKGTHCRMTNKELVWFPATTISGHSHAGIEMDPACHHSLTHSQEQSCSYLHPSLSKKPCQHSSKPLVMTAPATGGGGAVGSVAATGTDVVAPHRYSPHLQQSPGLGRGIDNAGGIGPLQVSVTAREGDATGGRATWGGATGGAEGNAGSQARGGSAMGATPQSIGSHDRLKREKVTIVAERDTIVAAVSKRDATVAAVSERDALKAQLEEVHQREAFTTAVGYLRGVDVIAKTSFEVTSQAHTYEWRGYGVKLHIQQDSLPADCRQCRVEMRSSLSGQYTLPADYELVSGVYWVYCPVKLSKCATLEVQHCSSQREDLSFVRAECTQELLPYVFRRQEGGVFSERSSYGSIELSRFSGWGIGWLKSLFQPDSQQYSGQVFYASEAPSKWQVLFAVRHRGDLDLDDTAFRQKLEVVMMRKISKVDPPFPVEFTADSIELKIPKPPKGWRLSCPTHPAIQRQTVDRFRARPNYLPPYCQLNASLCAGTEVGSILEERVGLNGAKEPFNFFLLECDPTTAANQRPSVDDSLYHGRMAGQQLHSPELMVFKEKRLILHVGIKNSIQDIARQALARGLIPDGVKTTITDTLNHLSAGSRTDLLLDELESRIRIDPMILTKFVEVLMESDPACYATLIRTITDALDSARAAV